MAKSTAKAAKATAAAPAKAPAKKGKAKAEWKVGDKVRVLRFAAKGWEVGTVAALVEGYPATAKIDEDQSMVGLAGLSWERQP